MWSIPCIDRDLRKSGKSVDVRVVNGYTGVIMGERRGRYAMSLKPSLVKRIDTVAKRWRMTRSQTVERLCEDSVDQADTFLRFIQDPVAGRAFMEAFGRPDVMKALVNAMQGEVDDKGMRLFVETVEKMALKTKTQ